MPIEVGEDNDNSLLTTLNNNHDGDLPPPASVKS